MSTYFELVPAAFGDGVTDATDAIQARLNAVSAAGGGMVIIPPGIYMVRGYEVKLPSYCTLAGCGMGITTLKMIAGDYSALAKCAVLVNDGYGGSTFTQNYNIFIQDLTLDGNTANVTPATEHEVLNIGNTTTVRITRCEFKNGPQEGIDFDYVADGVIDGCYVHDVNGDGIHTWTHNARITVSNCHIRGCAIYRDSAISNSSHNGVVANNIIESCRGGIYVPYMSADCYVSVTGNTIRDGGSKPAIRVTSGGVSVVGNTLEDIVYGYGVSIEVPGVVVAENTILLRTDRVAITLTAGADNCIVAGNRVLQAATGILLNAGATANLIHGNHLLGCTTPISDSGTSTNLADNVVA